MSLVSRSSLRTALGCIAGAGGLLVAACSSSSSTTSNGPATGCQPDGTLVCASADTGFVCAQGSRPDQVGCDPATKDANGFDDFCCYSGDTSSGCAPSDALTATCAPGTTGYQCTTSASPGSASLECSEPGPDAVSGFDDYCCGPRTSPPDGGGGTTSTPESGTTTTPEAGTD